MTREIEDRKELIEYIRKPQPYKIKQPVLNPKLEDEFFVFTLTAEQRKKVLAALVKIAVGIILITAGYFLPRSP